MLFGGHGRRCGSMTDVMVVYHHHLPPNHPAHRRHKDEAACRRRTYNGFTLMADTGSL